MPDTTFIRAPKEAKAGSRLVDVLQIIVIILAIGVVFYLFIITPHIVDGRSMEPNFYDKDLLIVNRIPQLLDGTDLGRNLHAFYQRGDVIIFQQPEQSEYIKRIIAGPGDTIKILQNKIFVNNKEIVEHYIPNEPYYTTNVAIDSVAFIREGEEISVPEGKYFVMGDNRQHSQDSRYIQVGFVSKNEIKGKVVFRLLPLEKFGGILTGIYDEK